MSIMANALAQAGLVPKEKAEKVSKQIDSRKYHLNKNRERYEFLNKVRANTDDARKLAQIDAEMTKLRGFIE